MSTFLCLAGHCICGDAAETEYEAKFTGVDKREARKRLRKAGARLVKPEFLQRRSVFNLPKGNKIRHAWLRVRDESDRITLSLKVNDGKRIQDQKEVMLTIDSFKAAEELLSRTGCEWKSYQENRRELWKLDSCEVTIDEWPFLEPFVEIEGSSENAVKRVSKKLGLDYGDAVFGSVDVLLSEKYGISKDYINNHVSLLTFNGRNPFAKEARRPAAYRKL